MTAFSQSQYLIFAIEAGVRGNLDQWTYMDVAPGNKDTVQKIAMRRGYPELARTIADRNQIRSVLSKLDRRKLLVPRVAAYAAETVRVLCGDASPRPTSGYAKYNVIDRPLRVGVPVFAGYDPLVFDVPIQFEDYKAGRTPGAQREDIEGAIQLLERMAGRGLGGPDPEPPTIVARCVNERGEAVWLLPPNYQASQQNTRPPKWLVTNIDWDENPLRDDHGKRIRQAATVTLTQDVDPTIKSLSATERWAA